MYKYRIIDSFDQIGEQEFDLLENAWKEHGEKGVEFDRDYVKEYTKFFLEQQNTVKFVVVVYNNDKPIGFIAVTASPHLVSRQWVAMPIALYVLPEYRKRNPKLLLNLLKAFEEFLEAAEIKKVYFGIVNDKGFSKILEKLGYSFSEKIYRR